MADKTTEQINDAETVDGKSLAKPNNPISRATLVMIAGTVLFIIIATVLFIIFFNAPTGKTGTNITNTELNISG